MRPQLNSTCGPRPRSAADLIPQDFALNLWLVMLAGKEPAGSRLELRHKPQGQAMRRLGFYPAHDQSQIMAVIERAARVGDVYVGAAPRVGRDGTAAGVERVWCLWADVDTPEALAALRKFRPLPSIVIRSGTGRNVHAWWPLHEAITPKWARRANRRLALALGADMAATDAARIMRPPATLNYKHSPPTRVEAVVCETLMFTLPEVVGSLPDSPEYVEPTLPAARHETPAPVDGPAALDGLARTVATAQQGNRNNALHWAACRAAERIDAGELDPAIVRATLRDAAHAAGLGEHEIEATLRSALDRARAAA